MFDGLPLNLDSLPPGFEKKLDQLFELGDSPAALKPFADLLDACGAYDFAKEIRDANFDLTEEQVTNLCERLEKRAVLAEIVKGSCFDMPAR